MTAYDFAAARPGKAARTALTARPMRLAADFYRAWKNRRAFYRLGELSDAELADIGLTRSDLHVAVAAPFASDPTVRLRDMTAERIRTAGDYVRQIA